MKPTILKNTAKIFCTGYHPFHMSQKKLLARQGQWNIFDCFLKVGRTALRIGIFDGSSLTIMGEMTDPIIPPNAPETRVATGFLSINGST